MSNINKNDLQLDCTDKFRKLPTLWFFYIYDINWKYDERLRDVLFKFGFTQLFKLIIQF